MAEENAQSAASEDGKPQDPGGVEGNDRTPRTSTSWSPTRPTATRPSRS